MVHHPQSHFSTLARLPLKSNGNTEKSDRIYKIDWIILYFRHGNEEKNIREILSILSKKHKSCLTYCFYWATT